VWLTRDMLESDAWRSLSLAARRVIDRVTLEHMAHAGKENGNLIVTYADFEKFGIRRASLKKAIVECVNRGFIVVTEKGRASAGPHRWPSKYALGWLPMRDGASAANRWKAWRPPLKSLPLPIGVYTRDIECSYGGGTGKNGANAWLPVSQTPLASGTGSVTGKMRISAHP